MLGKIFARFVEKSPLSVMVHGTLERVLEAAQRVQVESATLRQQGYPRKAGQLGVGHVR